MPVSCARPLHATNEASQLAWRHETHAAPVWLEMQGFRQCATEHWRSAPPHAAQALVRPRLFCRHMATMAGLPGLASAHLTSMGKTTVLRRIFSSSPSVHAPGGGSVVVVTVVVVNVVVVNVVVNVVVVPPPGPVVNPEEPVVDPANPVGVMVVTPPVPPAPPSRCRRRRCRRRRRP